MMPTIIAAIIINGMITPAAMAPALLASSGVTCVASTLRYMSSTSSGPGSYGGANDLSNVNTNDSKSIQ